MATADRPRAGERSSREIHRDIEEKRQQMDQTLEEVGDRLHPRRLLDLAIDFFQSREGNSGEYSRKARSATKQVGRQLKQHPVPATLIGLGVAWWLMESDDEEDDLTYRSPLADLPEHSGSVVDARTGEPYDESYGRPRRLPAAWDEDYEWSAEDQTAWSLQAQQAVDELQAALDDADASEEQKIRTAAERLIGVSGRTREELHAQWADLREYSGSVVDARTGEPYDETYGQEAWRGLAASAWLAGGDWPEQHRGSRDDEDRSGWRDSARQTVKRLQESLRDTGGSAREKLKNVAHHLGGFAAKSRATAGRSSRAVGRGSARATRSVRHAAHRTQHAAAEGYETAQRGLAEGYATTRDAFQEALDDYPLAVGAATLGLGLLAGLILPSTRREDRWFGEAADEAKERAQRVGEEVVSGGAAVAASAVAAADDELERQHLKPHHLKESAERVGSKVADAVDEELPHGDELRQRAERVASRAKEASKEEAEKQVERPDRNL